MVQISVQHDLVAHGTRGEEAIKPAFGFADNICGKWARTTSDESPVTIECLSPTVLNGTSDNRPAGSIVRLDTKHQQGSSHTCADFRGRNVVTARKFSQLEAWLNPLQQKCTKCVICLKQTHHPTSRVQAKRTDFAVEFIAWHAKFQYDG